MTCSVPCPRRRLTGPGNPLMELDRMIISFYRHAMPDVQSGEEIYTVESESLSE